MTRLLRSDRRGLHERVLRAMETQSPGQRDSAVDDLVHHAVLAEAWPEAARYALAAGERASRRSALTEAKAYLETAIAALGQQPASVATMTQGIDARLSLRGVLASMNDTSGIQEYLKEADNLAELAGDRLNLARVYISSRHHAVPLGRPARRHRTEPEGAGYHARRRRQRRDRQRCLLARPGAVVLRRSRRCAAGAGLQDLACPR